jgi:hypothetical protein
MTPTTTVDRVTVTATSSRTARWLAAALALAGAAALAACGSTQLTAGGATGGSHAFAWLRPAAPFHSWSSAALPSSPARLAYPASWHAITSDPGTRSAAIGSGSLRIAGYLNATPQQGSETLANWSTFRLDHNRDEGDTGVSLVASATGLRFLDGHGSCVIDDYTSSSGHRYREIACIVAGARATTVVVGAAPPHRWRRQSPAIERAISAFRT